MLSSSHDSPFILVLCISRSSRNSVGVTPCGAAKQRWGVKISQFSTNNLLYLKKRLKLDGTCCEALTRTEFSFDPCNIYRDCARGVHRGGQNVHFIDGYVQRGVLQALNSLSNLVKFTAIVPGATPYGGVKCKGVGKSCDFRPISRYSS